jgi:hypothetical protein
LTWHQQAERTDDLFKRACNDLDMKLNRLKDLQKSVEVFDPEADDILVLDTVKILYRDYQTKLAELMDVIPDDQCENRAAKVEEFGILYTTTIVTTKQQKIDHGPSEESENTGEQKPKVTTKIKLPDIPLQVFSGNLNEWGYFREKFKALITDNAALIDVQKHHYLWNSLLAEAETLQSVSDTFESLWNAVTDRYEMKRIIADNHINELFNIKNMTRECSADLRIMIDEVIKNLRVLATIELLMDALSGMFVENMVGWTTKHERCISYNWNHSGQNYLNF